MSGATAADTLIAGLLRRNPSAPSGLLGAARIRRDRRRAARHRRLVRTGTIGSGASAADPVVAQPVR